MSDSTAIAVVKRFCAEGPKSAVSSRPSTWRPRWTPTATLVCIAVYCTAEDLSYQEPVATQRRELTGSEVLTLCVATRSWGSSSDRRLFEGCRHAAWPPVSHTARPIRVPHTPSAPGGHHRMADGCVCQYRAPETPTICCEIDSTPLECARTRPDRSALGAGRGRRLRVLRRAFPVLLGV
jgi:hypothetical protein